ncbi:hypothetical protein TTHERM_00942670 (macronuclear) [Tetrahymena thermophila SB210]|uniref:Uncharacterized protein n=1 Tax=Tetrahymena thermophila (strain SB210) TaxID=312017 RepID=Q22DL2_TETTS|nr:hypothetical protein TTHERM_00942670 [Tetrahymena thermophila SB210]EAR83346.1 hypothetical protein TTHERM_00942670 [Tetrahymena thermophila SB210]|eukprot:XP_001031009.1 hypothetical protein TTHERM_00942670 [Tetrahymena thermophila SB210]
MQVQIYGIILIHHFLLKISPTKIKFKSSQITQQQTIIIFDLPFLINYLYLIKEYLPLQVSFASLSGATLVFNQIPQPTNEINRFQVPPPLWSFNLWHLKETNSNSDKSIFYHANSSIHFLCEVFGQRNETNNFQSLKKINQLLRIQDTKH